MLLAYWHSLNVVAAYRLLKVVAIGYIVGSNDVPANTTMVGLVELRREINSSVNRLSLLADNLSIRLIAHRSRPERILEASRRPEPVLAGRLRFQRSSCMGLPRRGRCGGPPARRRGPRRPALQGRLLSRMRMAAMTGGLVVRLRMTARTEDAGSPRRSPKMSVPCLPMRTGGRGKRPKTGTA